MRKITAYMGLLCGDGTEPDADAGYSRARVGEVSVLDILALPTEHQIVFNEITAPGCGLVSAYGAFEAPAGGEPLCIWTLPDPVNVHEGTIPVIYQGRLLLGIDVSANIILQSENAAGVANI